MCKKILHVQLLPLLSGVQRVSLNEISKLNNVYEFHMLCSHEGPLTQTLNKINVQCHIIPELVRNISPVKDFLALRQMCILIRNGGFDVVHTHSSKPGILGRIAAKLSGVKNVIHTVHGFAFPAAKNRLDYLIYYSMEWVAKFFTDHLIVLNQSDYDCAVKSLGYNPHKVTIIPNGVDTEKFKPNNKKSDGSIFNVIMVGRLWEQKDPMTLLQSINHIKDKVRGKIKLSVVGDGELSPILADYISRNSLDDMISLNGWCDNIQERLADSDIFVLPSKWEGMPLAILEALSSGLPCVVTDIPGNNDLVKNGWNGFLFNVGDYEALAESLLYLFNNDVIRHEVSENARACVMSNYSLKTRNDLVMRLYEK